jgi:hypothetical protein
MNNWVIFGIIIGVLLVGGIAFASAISTSANQTNLDTKTCTSCGGKCTAGSNCGLATCGAASGGKCTCGQK